MYMYSRNDKNRSENYIIRDEIAKRGCLHQAGWLAGWLACVSRNGGVNSLQTSRAPSKFDKQTKVSRCPRERRSAGNANGLRDGAARAEGAERDGSNRVN